jgi:hypothetical protein
MSPKVPLPSCSNRGHVVDATQDVRCLLIQIEAM